MVTRTRKGIAYTDKFWTICDKMHPDETKSAKDIRMVSHSGPDVGGRVILSNFISTVRADVPMVVENYESFVSRYQLLLEKNVREAPV